MILKLLVQGQPINVTTEKPDAVLNWKTQMNNPCWDTINHSKRGRNSSGELTLSPHPQIAFAPRPSLALTRLKVTLDIMARPFSNSSKYLLSTSSQAHVKLENQSKDGYFLSNYYSVIWYAKELCRYFLQERELVISWMKNICMEGCCA